MSESAAINLTINVGNAPKTLGEIKTELQEIGTAGESATDKVTQGVEEVTTSTVSLKTQLRQMKEELATLPEGSEEFRNLAAAAGEVQDKLAMVNNSIKSVADNKTNIGFQALAQSGQAIAGGFQAAQGAMALFGTDSEAVQKAIQNVIAVQGVMNGVMAINNVLQDDSILGIKLRLGLEKLQKGSAIAMTAVQKALNAAMAANPIGLIVLGIGLLIAAFVAFKKPIMDVINSFKSLGDVLNFLISPFTSVLKWMGLIEDKEAKVEKQRQDQSKANRARHRERLAQIEKESKEYSKAKDEEIRALEMQIDTLDAEGKATEELRLQVLEAERDKLQSVLESNRLKLESQRQLFEDTAKMNGKSAEQQAKAWGFDYNEVVAAFEKTLQDEEDALLKAQNNITRFNREQLEKRQQAQQSASDEIVEIVETEEDLKTKAEETEAQKRKRIYKEEQAKKTEERLKAEENLKSQIAKIEEDYRISLLEDQEKEIDAVRLKYEQLLIDAEEFGLNTAELKEAQEYELAQIEEKYRQQKLEADKELADQQRELRSQQVANTIETGQQILNIATSLNDLATSREIENIKRKQQAGIKLSKGEEQRLKRDEQIRKAFAVAQVAIDTASSISSAIAGATASAAATGPGAVIATPLFIASQIATVLGAFASVAGILSAPSPSFSSPSGSNEIGNDFNNENTPPDTDQFNTGSTQITPPTKVYVLEQDITDTQGMVAKIKQQATFG